jgi:tRNA A37 threonylcarbamoyladenosine biosynthesis protein TsaE
VKKILSKSLDDTSRIAREWLVSLEKKEAKNKDSALVVGLSGNLGSGKTAFVKAVAKELGIKEQVTSPTFVIEKIYTIGSNGSTFAQASADRGNDLIDSSGSIPPFEPQGLYSTTASSEFPWKRLVHIDAYRIESARELEVLNFEELVEDQNNLILIEWPENVKEILPEGALTIKCEFVSETEREYGFE